MRVFPHSRKNVSSVANVVLRGHPQSNSGQLTSSSHRLMHPLTANKSDIIATDDLLFISHSHRAVLDY